MDLVSLFLAPDWDDLAFEEALDRSAPGDVDAILDLATSDDADVRLHLAQNLVHLSRGDAPSPRTVQTAIALTADPDIRVRSWACFALGTQWDEIDTAELRDALAARLDDVGRDARSEALMGLALRRDPRAHERVREALSRPSGVVYTLEMRAAGALSDPALHPLVLQHQTGWESEQCEQNAMLARRLTDPAGPGDDVLDGLADDARRRARGEGAPLSSAWFLMHELVEVAPHRRSEIQAEVVRRLGDDAAAVRVIVEQSALSEPPDEP